MRKPQIQIGWQSKPDVKSQAKLKKMYKDFKTKNIKLKQKIEMQGQTIEELKCSVADLRRRLARHDSYNTPPSQKRAGVPDTKKNDDKNDKSAKTRHGQVRGGATGDKKTCGGQKGHEGRTCRPNPTEFKEHTPNACPECGSGRNSSVSRSKHG